MEKNDTERNIWSFSNVLSITKDNRFRDTNVINEWNYLEWTEIQSILLDVKEKELSKIKYEMYTLDIDGTIVSNDLDNDIIPRFTNLATWEEKREQLINLDFRGDRYLCKFATTEKIRELLNAFKEGNTALFTIIRSPNIQPFFVPWEIIEMELDVSKGNAYWIPMVRYGKCKFYLYEVAHTTQKEYNEALDGWYIALPWNRLLPTKDMVKTTFNLFWNMVWLYNGWEEKYDKLLSSWGTYR